MQYARYFTILLLFSLMGCSFTGKEHKLKHYDLDKPDKFFMPESLLEISGIAFNQGNSDTIYGVQDEQGRLFGMPWGVKKQFNTKFGKSGDYEDLAILNGLAFILKSNGHLFSFPLSDMQYEEAENVSEWKKILPKAEYEGMYGDESTNRLYIICKNCPDNNSKDRVTGYIVQAGDSVYQAGTFQVNVKEIKSLTGKVKRGFRPSGLARNPVTSEWYIISSVNKLLVVTDKNWKVKEACFLNGNTFNQPEGIAFDKAGNLYIANEGDDLSQGNILKFVRSN